MNQRRAGQEKSGGRKQVERFHVDLQLCSCESRQRKKRPTLFCSSMVAGLFINTSFQAFS